MDETQNVAYPDTVAIEPPPPSPVPAKPPTLATLLVERLQTIEEKLAALDEDLWYTLHDLLTRGVAARTWALVAIGVAGLSVLLNIAMLVLVAFLLGHVR